MIKHISLILIIGFIFSSTTIAQEYSSISFSVGSILPHKSALGFNSQIQLTIPVKENLYFYAYAGYSEWNDFNYDRGGGPHIHDAVYNYQFSNRVKYFLPVYFGRKQKLFNWGNSVFFFDLELGYAFLNYNMPVQNEYAHLVGLGTGFTNKYKFSPEFSFVVQLKTSGMISPFQRGSIGYVAAINILGGVELKI